MFQTSFLMPKNLSKEEKEKLAGKAFRYHFEICNDLTFTITEHSGDYDNVICICNNQKHKHEEEQEQ